MISPADQDCPVVVAIFLVFVTDDRFESKHTSALRVNIRCRNSILYSQLRLGRPNLKDRETVSIEKPRVANSVIRVD